MFPLFESIKVSKKRLFNISYHNQRLNQARKMLFGLNDWIDLRDIIIFPKNLGNGLYKCRVPYGKNIGNIEFIPYHKPLIRSLMIIEADDIDYAHKFTDRSAIDFLFQKKGECDDILIVKKGLITDTSYCNILFFDGNNWLTPSHPLLPGTKRARLIEEGIIQPATIKQDDLKHFSHAALINAMLDLDPKNIIPIENICFG